MSGSRPYRRALSRLRRTLSLDTTTLQWLRQAAETGGSTELATYGWALGVAPGGATQAGPVVAAQVYEQAVRQGSDDPAVAFGMGLANAGGFGQRRGVAPAARRGFGLAAKLDPDNALPHLALAAVRHSAGDLAAAHEALDRAREAPRWRLYPSPLAGLLDASAPWLTQGWQTLWPGRVRAMLRFLMTREARVAARLQHDGQDSRPTVARLEAVGRSWLDPAAARPAEYSLASGFMLSLLRWRGEALNDPAAIAAAEAVGGLCEELLHARQALGARFESALATEAGAAGVGLAGGLAAVGVGLVRSRRRWPPPWPALGWSGRGIAAVGLLAGGLAVSSLYVQNPATTAHRRAVERRLVATEVARVAATARQIQDQLAALPRPAG